MSDVENMKRELKILRRRIKKYEYLFSKLKEEVRRSRFSHMNMSAHINYLERKLEEKGNDK